ncbi:MAG: beta-galactosidase [Candidatus Marinimicrobia bacterium]|nr:beta-galactosidase [Candidatus Neomarinimicrobiota bacterium]
MPQPTSYPPQSLDGIWQFTFQAEQAWTDENLARLAYDDRIAVPSAFDALPAYNGRRGVGFYRRLITVPPGQRARLRFNAVGMYAKVFIDQQKVGEQYAAYTPFVVEVPKSERAERELVVMAGNRFDEALYPLHLPDYDFYAYGGIFRSVTLELLPEGELVEWVGVDTVDPDAGELLIRVRPARPGQAFHLSLDDGPTEILTATDVRDGEARLPLRRPGLSTWSPDSPALHTLAVDNGTHLHTVRFGVRRVTAAEGRILLNGKPLKLLGYCRHEAHPQFGPALPLAQLVADLHLLRDLGCNFIRGAHYQQDPRFLDLCDELGFLVFEESLGWGNKAEQLADPAFIAAQVAQTTALINSAYNHPSVILRGFLNEGQSDAAESWPCYDALIRLVRAQDPTRLVTYASNRALQDRFLEHVDVVSFNIYPGWYAADIDEECPLAEIRPRIQACLAGLRERGLAHKPFLLTEIGAGAIYGWRDPVAAHWSEDYQRDYLATVCHEVVDNPAIAGVALWQFCDGRTYRGARALRRPRAFNNKGTLDEYRRPKLAYDTVKAIFTA